MYSFFKTSIRPTFDSLLPDIALLKSASNSGGNGLAASMILPGFGLMSLSIVGDN